MFSRNVYEFAIKECDGKLGWKMGEVMDWIKKHTDTVVVLGAILTSVMWMNGKFNEIEKRFSDVENRLTKIETIIYIKGLVSNELAHKGE